MENNTNVVKNNSSLKVLLVLLVFLVLGLAGYIIYDKFTSDDHGEDAPIVDNNNEVKLIDLSSDLTKSLIKSAYISNLKFLNELKNGSTNSFSDQQKFLITISNDGIDYGSGSSIDYEYPFYTVLPADVKSAMQKQFGSAVSYTDQSFNDVDLLIKFDGKGTYLYDVDFGKMPTHDDSIDIYRLLKEDEAGAPILSLEMVVNKVEKKDDTYTMYAYNIYKHVCSSMDCDEPKVEYYLNTSDVLLTNGITGEFGAEANWIYQYTDEQVIEKINKLGSDKIIPTYKYTFALEDGNYIWTNFEKIS